MLIVILKNSTKLDWVLRIMKLSLIFFALNRILRKLGLQGDNNIFIFRLTQ